MAFLPVAAPIIGSIGGALLGNKGQKQAAQQAADAQNASQQQQAQLANAQFEKALAYDQAQKSALRNAVSGFANQNFATAAQGMHPQFMGPGGGAHFSGGTMGANGSPSSGAPSSSSMDMQSLQNKAQSQGSPSASPHASAPAEPRPPVAQPPMPPQAMQNKPSAPHAANGIRPVTIPHGPGMRML